ncbi:uncharacterized protein LOC114071012, partial [Empidonax traillii]|uniref:uncharacterized protein LOC114071012 n=1 Tax=Empidonax traillii TaxID=164674 RepID=UPI000FFD7B75
MCSAGRRWGRRQRVLLWGVLLAAWEAAWGQLRYSVPEEMPKGSFVGDVAKDLGLQLPALADRGVRIIDRGRTQYFTLHGKTGHLVTAERIDREQLCRLVEKCVLRCELIVEGEMKVYEIDVEITDINDNSPTFKDTEVEEKISEMNTPGSHFSLPRAHDPDSGQNSLQSYELSGDEHFSLAVQTGPGGDQRPELVLAKALDREEAAFHELVLRAIDGGDPARTGTARIRVTVVDANDNAPVFSQAEYTVRVPEDVPVGSTLITVTATDADEGMNGNVRYSLKKETDMALDIFHLDSETGEITLMRSLDFEEGNAYEMEVQARDGGQLYDTAKVEITVTDINDNAPKLTVTSQLSEVSEDSPTGTVVALLHVQDQDSGANGEVRCSLDGNVPFLLERSQGSYYRVVTARELDREQQSEYNVTVRASDGGWPALQSSRVLALRVLDVNDNAPVFSQERYSARLRENNAAGALVLVWRLHSRFSRQRSSKVAAVLWRRLRVSLLAAAERRWSRSRRRRSVLPPQAARSPGQWRPERQRHGQQSVALAVLARLRRAGPPAVLRCLGAQRFSLAGAAFPPDFCEGTLPYSYNLCVSAPARAAAEAAWPPPPLPILPAGEPCDKPSPSSSAVAGEPPTDPDAPQRLSRVFEFPMGKAGRSSLGSARCLQCREEAAGAAVDREEREEGRSAAAPPAADRLDSWIAGFLGLKGVGFRSSRGADLCYSEAEGLVGEAESGKSEREQEPGHLSAAVICRQCCGAGGVAAAMCSAGRRWDRRQRVLLWGVLLAAWEAAWGQLRYSVPEEMPKGSFVGDVAKDLGLQHLELGDRRVRILDKGRTQYFALHGKTGHLVTAERIDREQLCRLVEQCVLRCELMVEEKMQVYEIEVVITDINDNAPSFREEETQLRISETTTPGSRFPLPRAHDPDSGQNSLQSYELSGDEHFSLAVQTGPGGDQRPELVLAKALDREEAAFHELVLRAMDGGDPTRTGTARIRVTVVDANDNAPVFSQAEYTVRVAEDVPVGSVLVTVTASDADEGLNGDIKYSMKKTTHSDSDIFYLDSDTGAITLLRSLDFEEGDSYELEVQAHDGGALFDTTRVAISVTDVNDNVPEMTVSSALSEISEDAPSGTVVALLHVHDRDSGANGEVRCSLDGNVPFRLEKSLEDYYRVVTARELDREQQSEYNVTVRASDGGWPALQSSRVLALRVLDVNDNAPVFSQERYSARLRENNAAGALVLVVRATDADWGGNARVRY